MAGPVFFQAPTAGAAFAGAQVGTMGNFTPAASLPWNPTPSPAPTSAAGLAANYQSEYMKSLAMNQANYNNIMSGYQNLISQQAQGHKELYNSVLGTLSGAEESRKVDIGDMAKAEHGQMTQSLINRGLGNTTVQEAVASGVEANKQRRLNSLTGEFAQMRAGYQSQLGQNQLSGLAALTRSQLDFMNSIQAQYPDAGMYGSLAQRFAEADALRGGGGSGSYSVSSGGLAGGGGMGMPGPKVGYVPSPAPNVGGGYYQPPVSTGGGYGMMGAPAPAMGGGGNWNVPSWDNSAYFASQQGQALGGAGAGFIPETSEYLYSGGGDF